jgi:cytoskeleton protein RodZ
MTNAGFGEHLRREREMRGVSLEEIAKTTRISTRFLDALEKEAWDRLPGGVFNRGFVRTVARFLGLEEESLLAEYALALRLPGATAIPSELPPRPSSLRWVPWIALAIAMVLALAAAGWSGWRWISARRAQLTAASNALPAAPAPPAPPPNLWAPATSPVASPVASTQLTSPWAALQPQAPRSPAANPARELRLKIDASRDTPLTVTADGQQVFAGIIFVGESHNITAKNALTVETQDAGAIHLELNGQALAPIGPPGEPGKITLGRPSAKTDGGGRN